ncbi:ClpP/crotonase-like domain-containing protein [Lentinula aff. detonsa]|uniref:ClpP/crotonase-like domain-containing protein n=1 Tax=Lentinula aff. detonsa TaxID=2804958 RepID=A0AA38KZX7_9AGAR|nr:ClpP/crotonase-like domain-containing protein [Lentinula aff. detonsa]KAJ3802923.1 ClpP/crotonase-like domain-containing protein [Lentinula aff. detonsa]
MSTLSVNVSDGIATITMNRPKSFNAITVEDYDAFANALREIDRRDDVLLTVWQATGKWFCAGTDVMGRSLPNIGPQTETLPTDNNLREMFLKRIAHTTTDCGQALYSHSKILVAALNGPVMGIAAAFLGYFDFIFAVADAWLSVPFTFLGIISEGGSSVSFINRMGPARANEVLIWGKKKTAQELVACNFINEIFPSKSAEEFHADVLAHLKQQLEGLDPAAVLAVKKLLRAGLNEKNDPNAVNLRESYAQAERFASGVPERQFGRIARKEIRHKL